MLGHRQRKPRSHLDTKIAELGTLVGIRREQPDPPQTKITQNGGGRVVIPGIDRQTQSQIGVNGVKAPVLQRVRVQLGVQADTAALMPAEVDDHTEALTLDLSHCCVELFAAIAAPRSQRVAGEALGMDPNERNMAVASGTVEIAQHECYVLAVRGCGVPMELEGPVRGREHGRHDPAHPLRFGHLASLPQRLRPLETCLATSKGVALMWDLYPRRLVSHVSASSP